MSTTLERNGIDLNQFDQYVGRALESSHLQLTINSHSEKKSDTLRLEFRLNKDKIKAEKSHIKIIFSPNNKIIHINNLVIALSENNQIICSVLQKNLQKSIHESFISFTNPPANTWSITFKKIDALASTPERGTFFEASYFAPLQPFCKTFLDRTFSEVRDEIRAKALVQAQTLDSEENTTESTTSTDLYKSQSSFTDLKEEMEEFEDDSEAEPMDTTSSNSNTTSSDSDQ